MIISNVELCHILLLVFSYFCADTRLSKKIKRTGSHTTLHRFCPVIKKLTFCPAFQFFKMVLLYFVFVILYINLLIK